MCNGNCNCKEESQDIPKWYCTNCDNNYDVHVKCCPNCGATPDKFSIMCEALSKMLDGAICELRFVGEDPNGDLQIILRANYDNADSMWNWKCEGCGNVYDYGVDVCPNCNIKSVLCEVEKVIEMVNIVLTIDGIYVMVSTEVDGDQLELMFRKKK